MSQDAPKRVVPPCLRKVLDLDVVYTQKFVTWATKYLPFHELQFHYKALEVSCHGIPWIGFWLAFSWLFNDESLVSMQVNMLLGLFLDIIFVAVIKAYVRRKRPKANKKDAIAEMGPDVFSFPSGHASRATFVAFFFILLHPLHPIFFMPLISWAGSVCLSRVLQDRHHILDVLGGIALGLFEVLLLGLLWLGDGTAKWLLNYLSDEKRDGGEYHV